MSVDQSDIVAIWEVPLSDGVHKIEFEHGTTTGKRVVRVDGQELLRKDWMFKLVGRETFTVAQANCAIAIEALGSFAYEYSLEVNGKAYQKFTENQSKVLQCWTLTLDQNPTRICLDAKLQQNTAGIRPDLNEPLAQDTMKLLGEFVDNGTETHFEVGTHVCFIRATSSGNRKMGMLHQLFVDQIEIPPDSSS